MKKKEKKYIAPNECSTKRWIAVAVVGSIIGIILSIPVGLLATNQVDTFMGIRYSEIFSYLSFVGIFVGFVLALKWIGKTSLKDFILGVGGKVNKKECLTVLGLFTLGFVVSYLLVAKNIRVRGVNPGEFAFLVLFMLLTTWMQTTYEELIFRGLFIRWACKNEVGFTKKALIGAAISSVFFALMHAPNPEVTTQSGIRVVISMMNYAIPGLLMYIANLYFGSLLPGILIHWANNFLLFTVITSEVTVMPVPTLLVDTTPHHAELVMLVTLVTYMPLLVYMYLDAQKKKKAASV
ncbi:MAG: CPBP family intramembrane metalloprotease [Oscillospiraceae bacterium]|nr:CPBP family intramembrane metalloprotease [Oscillospiraceae bacterium]